MPNQTLAATLRSFPTTLLRRTALMHQAACTCDQCLAIIAELDSRKESDQ